MHIMASTLLAGGALLAGFIVPATAQLTPSLTAQSVNSDQGNLMWPASDDQGLLSDLLGVGFKLPELVLVTIKPETWQLQECAASNFKQQPTMTWDAKGLTDEADHDLLIKKVSPIFILCATHDKSWAELCGKHYQPNICAMLTVYLVSVQNYCVRSYGRACTANDTLKALAQTPKLDTGEPGTITVEMYVAATPTNPPVITGSASLPDGTILSVYLLGDPPACVPDCGLQFNSATVESGRFTTTLQGGFTTTLQGPHPLISNSYTIDIAMDPSLQSQSVQSVIGKLGEHLRGPYVVTFGLKGEYVPVEFPRSNPTDNEKSVGYTIHYTQKIFIAGNASSDAASKTQAIAQFRKSNVKSCTSNVDFVNALVRSGVVSGSETLGAERQAKIDACVAHSDATLQAALKSQGQSGAEPEHSMRLRSPQPLDSK